MIKSRCIGEVEVTAFNFSPNESDWKKFLDFARKAAPFELKSRIKSVFVYALYFEHGTHYHVSYTAVCDAGTIPERKIEEADNDNRT